MKPTKSKDEKLIKLFLDDLQKRTEGLTWLTDTEENPFPGQGGIWLIDDENKTWLFEIRPNRFFIYINKSEFTIFSILLQDKQQLLENTLKDWVYFQTGIRPEFVVMHWTDPQTFTVDQVLTTGVPYSRQD